MKRLKPVLITTIIMAALAVAAVLYLSRSGDTTKELDGRIVEDQRDEAEERAYRYDTGKTAVKLVKEGEEKNVLNFDGKRIYDVASSKSARDRLDRLIKRMTPTFEEPVIAANPFGTNENSFYFYFETSYRGMVRYTVTVEDETIPDLVRYVNNGQENNLSETHEFTVSGLVPGMTNYIWIEVLDKTGAKRENITYSYEVPAVSGKNRISFEKGKSKAASTLGLYFVFPKDSDKILAYDNSGILRNVTNTEGVHGTRFYQAGDSVFYQVTDTKVAKVSATGQVTGVAEVKGYGKIEDFSYDGYDNIYALVKKKGRQYLISASFQTGKTRQVFQFPKNIAAKSLSTPVAGNLYVAASRPDGLMKIKALTGNTPKLAFILGQKKKWKHTPYKKRVFQDENVVNWKTGNAVLNLTDDSDGKNDVLSAYLEDKGKGTGLEFRVQGKDKSVQIINSLPVGLGRNSGCQSYQGHMILSDGNAGKYAEYDNEGKTTKEFSIGKPADAIVKCSLNGLCFYAG